MLFPLLNLLLPGEAEKRLVERLQHRETEAMAELYDRFKSLVYSITFHAVRDRGVAEDLLQETFWRVWNRIATFDAERGNLEGWIATIARNRAVDYLRSARGARTLLFEPIETNPKFSATTDSAADRIGRERLLVRALEALNAAQREVIELAHFQGMTQSEIAELLKRPLGTVKGTMRSALKLLREAVGGEAA